MTQTTRSNKIINLSRRRMERNSMNEKGAKNRNSPASRVIAITSGKGGVGKTNIVANLGFALTRLGKKVLILDADLSLGNLDILLGLAPTHNLSHVLAGAKTIPQITVDGPGNMKILPASSGIQELTQLTKPQQINILTELDQLGDSIDIVLIDTAAGISSNVMYFATAAQEIMVVVSPEPTSITDAYALMKVLSLKYSENHFRLLVNLARTVGEAEDVFRQLNLVAERFLNISIEYVGCVLYDENVTKSVKHQKLVCEMYPDSRGSRCFRALAETIGDLPPLNLPDSDTHCF